MKTLFQLILVTFFLSGSATTLCFADTEDHDTPAPYSDPLTSMPEENATSPSADEHTERQQMDALVEKVRKWAFHVLEVVKKTISPAHFKKAEQAVGDYEEKVNSAYPEEHPEEQHRY